MAVTLDGAARTLSLRKRPATTVLPAVRPTGPAPATGLGMDTVTAATLTATELRARLEPVFQMMAAAGFSKEANRVRRARLVLTDGKAFGVEYYAAAYPFNLVCFNRTLFKDLTTKELASILIHESTHLDQGLLLKGYSNLRSWGGRHLKADLAEKEAYLKQQRANAALGLTSGEIVWTTNEALKAMGLPVTE